MGMKHLFIITLVLMSFISSPSWSERIYDLVGRDGVYYLKFSQVPFTGEIEGRTQGSFKNGLREGSWVSYRDNCQLASAGDYKNGKKEGSWVSYHKNGQLRYKGDYKNGEEEGSWVGYKVSGSVWKKFTGTFKEGVKISD
ncbi:MAG: hypothetical protein QMC17_02655 [Paracoccaceae bacterium]